MDKFLTYPVGLDRFNPLGRVLTYDVFNTGFNGWMTLLTNFTQAPDFDIRYSIVNKTQFAPVMLSSATYRYPGTHGAMSGAYSLKISTRPVANRYEMVPDPGGLGQAIKRLTIPSPKKGQCQIEAWLTYTVEQDHVSAPGMGSSGAPSGSGDLAALNERSIRAFGAAFDVQNAGNRFFVGCRYLNSVNSELKQKWQYIQASDVSREEWTHGSKNEWANTGIDPMWYGRRYPDGTHDGFKDIPGGEQKLCYNETDCKINWIYFRLLFDLETRQYVEMQAQDRIFDLRGKTPTLSPPYHRIDGLLNPLFWVENDTNRRVFLYIDSVVVSID